MSFDAQLQINEMVNAFDLMTMKWNPINCTSLSLLNAFCKLFSRNGLLNWIEFFCLKDNKTFQNSNKYKINSKSWTYRKSWLSSEHSYQLRSNTMKYAAHMNIKSRYHLMAKQQWTLSKMRSNNFQNPVHCTEKCGSWSFTHKLNKLEIENKSTLWNSPNFSHTPSFCSQSFFYSIYNNWSPLRFEKQTNKTLITFWSFVISLQQFRHDLTIFTSNILSWVNTFAVIEH